MKSGRIWGLVCCGLVLIAGGVTRAEHRYNGPYTGANLDHVAFPMGGIGAGMICLEGTGMLSHYSLRNGLAWTDQQIAEAFSCHLDTVADVRRRLVQEGLTAAVERKKQDQPSRLPKLDGRGEAGLIALARSQPPEGQDRWTLKLLAERLVELEVVDSISDQTVRRALKKRHPAAPPKALRDSARSGCRVCRLHGGCVGRV
jgi:transposase